MCELLGLSANMETTITRSFSSLAERGGNTGPHRDGWGITFYEGVKGCRTFKDTSPSCCSDLSTFIQDLPIRSHMVVAHIRQANRGLVRLENTHPFTRELWGRCWTFAHNGQLDNYESLETGDFVPLGQTDSEQAFCWLLNQMKQQFSAQPDSMPDVFSFIADKATYLNTIGVFNMLFTDGEFLMAFCGSKLTWITRKAPFGEVQFNEGRGTHNLAEIHQNEDVTSLIATQPVTDESWHQLEVNDYALFKNGKCVSCVFDV